MLSGVNIRRWRCGRLRGLPEGGGANFPQSWCSNDFGAPDPSTTVLGHLEFCVETEGLAQAAHSVTGDSPALPRRLSVQRAVEARTPRLRNPHKVGPGGPGQAADPAASVMQLQCR